MNTEQKAKAYDEALRKAKDMLSYKEVRQEDMEYLFPELKESEDERIKRNLIAALKGEGYYDCDLTNECIAWLEKQGEKLDEWKEGDIVRHGGILALVVKGRKVMKQNGEQITIQYPDEWVKADPKERDRFFEELEKQGDQKSIWHNEDEEPKRGSLILLIMQSGTPIVAKIIEPNHTFSHGERWAYIDDLLEKQGEQKSAKNIVEKWKDMRLEVYQQASGNRHEPNYSDDATKMFSLNDIDEIFEKIAENYTENPADEVKSKFKKEKWIVWQDTCYKVNYNGCEYELIDQNGLSTSLEYGTINKNAHLWDIAKDAKDGDVLIVPKRDGSEHSELIFMFKEIKDRDNVKNAVEYYCRVVDNKFYVNERGFMGRSHNYFVPATKEQRDTLFTKMREAGYEWDADKKELKITDFSKHLKYNPNAPSIIEWESSWSEEDDAYLTECINAIATKDGWSFEEKRKTKHWLKSLKKRIQN